MYRRTFKPIIDKTLALIILILILPFCLFACLAIKIDSSGPIFFRQSRLGLNGKEFALLKFRTMIDANRDSDREILAGDPEVTRVGRLLRRFKVDELPQLVNVLKGDMSLVGPRPCLPELASHFNDDGEKRLLAKPGLTGLAQVSGNIYLTWPERWALDAQYVRSASARLDTYILCRTFLIVLLGEERFLNRQKTRLYDQ